MFVNDNPLTWSDPLGLRLAGEGTESCGGTATHLTCNGASPSGVSVAATINTKSAKRSVVVGTTKVTVSTSVTVTTHGSTKAPTVNINMSGGASVALPGYPSITASSSGAMNAALGNNSGGNLSVGTDGFTYTDSIPPATIGGSSVNGSISASAFFTDDSPSPSGGGFDWIPVVGAVVTTAGEWYLCVQSDGLICELPPT